MGLVLMRGLALKKCMAGGKSALTSSSCFIFNRRVFSRNSASVSTICPPVCMEASSWIRNSLCVGSGKARTPDEQHNSRQATAAWGRCSKTAIFKRVGAAGFDRQNRETGLSLRERLFGEPKTLILHKLWQKK